MTLRLGISTCPNDTFAFHGLLTDQVHRRGLDLSIELMDIQELNERLRAGTFEVAKASFFMALRLAETYGVLPVGSALGYGVGPLLLSSAKGAAPHAESRLLAPGRDTTAALLTQGFVRDCPPLEHAHFAEIMPALQRGDADFGAVIHEGRFVYEMQGLHLAMDLGEEWERSTGLPLPLGGLLARHDLGADTHRRLTAIIRDSLAIARADEEGVYETMRRHAQELDDGVIAAHIDLYVNDATVELGDVGAHALGALGDLARRSGALDGSPRLTVLDD